MDGDRLARGDESGDGDSAERLGFAKTEVETRRDLGVILGEANGLWNRWRSLSS